mmetsp:Transcript_15058/g.39103  ORF Transcript_15058/g.39103 Transcript_15058/m.39103 type:complete len:260 (+) Transcript_15058:1019-1798(+)
MAQLAIGACAKREERARLAHHGAACAARGDGGSAHVSESGDARRDASVLAVVVPQCARVPVREDGPIRGERESVVSAARHRDDAHARKRRDRAGCENARKTARECQREGAVAEERRHLVVVSVPAKVHLINIGRSTREGEPTAREQRARRVDEGSKVDAHGNGRRAAARLRANRFAQQELLLHSRRARAWSGGARGPAARAPQLERSLAGVSEIARSAKCAGEVARIAHVREDLREQLGLCARHGGDRGHIRPPRHDSC